MSSVFDHPVISERYFFPRRDPLPEVFWVDAGACRLACLLLTPHPGARTVVFFHGNGEVAADYLGPFADQIASLGLNLLVAEYRGYGLSSGVPALDAMLDDAEAVLSASGQQPEELLLFGRSVGSIYAIHAAAHWPRVAGLILESGIADPLERVLLRVDPREIGSSHEAMAAAAAARFDHRSKLQKYPGPTLVLHAADDSLVPVDNARRLADWAAGPTRLQVFPSGDHNAILAVNWSAYWREVADFVELIENTGTS